MQSETADLPPPCRHVAKWTKHTRRLCFWPIPALYANITPSTKPEVHNLSHWRQKRTEPLPQVIRVENFVKFGRVVFETCERIDRQTDKHAVRNTSHPNKRRVIVAFIYKLLKDELNAWCIDLLDTVSAAMYVVSARPTQLWNVREA